MTAVPTLEENVEEYKRKAVKLLMDKKTSACYTPIISFLAKEDCKNSVQMCTKFKDVTYKEKFGNQVICPFLEGSTCGLLDYSKRNEDLMNWMNCTELTERIQEVAKSALSSLLKRG